jgi:hypothetical protein
MTGESSSSQGRRRIPGPAVIRLEAVWKGCLEPLRERLDRICTVLLSALVKRSQTTLYTASENAGRVNPALATT